MKRGPAPCSECLFSTTNVRNRLCCTLGEWIGSGLGKQSYSIHQLLPLDKGAPEPHLSATPVTARMHGHEQMIMEQQPECSL